MKNIHILPTDNPSRLVKIKDNLFYTTTENIPHPGVYQHMYITSDEEIKIGDWVYCLREGFEPILKQKVNTIGVNNDEMMKKIILTTDQDLIKDGVQPIDDEFPIDDKFLEWYIKNPSCEWVPIIPKLFGHPYIIWIEGLSFKEKSKQEILEETAERLAKDAYKKHSVKDDKLSLDEQIQRSGGFIVGFKEGMIEGAKWQQEKMYSEEEVLELILKSKIETSNLYYEDMKEWFEQFKKK